MKIGEVSRQTGASHKAIRHYENMGLLGDVRRQGSYRSFSQQDVNLIRLIRAAQQLGFKLSELVACVGDDSLPTWQQVLKLIEHKQTIIRQQLEQLNQVNDQLEELRQELHACLGSDDEPLDLLDIECDWLGGNIAPVR